MSKLFKIFSTILFLAAIIYVGSITFQVAKAIVDLYLYPNIADIRTFAFHCYLRNCCISKTRMDYFFERNIVFDLRGDILCNNFVYGIILG